MISTIPGSQASQPDTTLMTPAFPDSHQFNDVFQPSDVDVEDGVGREDEDENDLDVDLDESENLGMAMGLDKEDEELLDEHEETIFLREFDCKRTTKC
jgi:hypothetical protein